MKTYYRINKNAKIISCESNNSILKVSQILSSHKVSCALITQGELAVGILTERDLIRLFDKRLDIKKTKVSEVMSTPLKVIREPISWVDFRIFFERHSIRHALVLNPAEEITRIVTQTDLVQRIQSSFFVDLNNVESAMQTDIAMVAKDQMISQAVLKMAKQKISSIIITDGRMPVGIVTERDIVYHIANGIQAKKIPLYKIMSTPLRTIPLDEDVFHAARIMKENNIRRLAITKSDGKVIGILTQSDIIRSIGVHFLSSLTKFAKDILEELNHIDDHSLNLLSRISDMIYTLDSQGYFTYVNPVSSAILGHSSHEIIGAHFSEVVHPEDHGKIKSIINERRRGKNRTSIQKIRFTQKNKKAQESGYEYRLVEISPAGIYLKDEKGRYMFKGSQGVARDITHKTKLEESLAQSEKLSTVGELVAGVAHDLRNPLTGIIGYSELLLLEESTEIKETLSKIFDQAIHCTQIIEKLLTFSKQEKILEKEPMNVAEVTDKAIDLVEHQLRVYNVKIIKKYDENTPMIVGNSRQIQQAFINIILNACFAMYEKHEEGEMTIKISSHKKKYVNVVFRDNGPGIPTRLLNKIFNSFFTTKSQGTGLGLSMASRIVKDHSGSISASNDPQGGAIFQIRFPVYGANPEILPSTHFTKETDSNA